MIPSLTILEGDWLEQAKAIPDASVHCCVTSPPYDNLRSYNGFHWDFEGTARELYRVLCDGGVLCWNVGDSVIGGSETLTSCKQKIFFREQCGFLVHDTMIYERLNFSSPEKVRYHQCFEYVFVLSKGSPRCFNPIMDRKNICGGQSAWGQNTKRQVDGSLVAKKSTIYAAYGMRTNVWKGKTRGQEEPCTTQPHPAPMPRWLARDLILSWSNAGDAVLDPMSGSGTTGEEALKLGRNAILCDISGDYIKLARYRCAVTPGLAL